MAVPNVEHIYETLKELKLSGVHIEITNLVVPKIGDSMDRIKHMAKWIKDYLGTDTPFHLLRFHPDYKLTTIPATAVEDMERALYDCQERRLKLRLPRQRARSPRREHLLPQLRHSHNQTLQLRNHPVETNPRHAVPRMRTTNPNKRQNIPKQPPLSILTVLSTQFVS